MIAVIFCCVIRYKLLAQVNIDADLYFTIIFLPFNFYYFVNIILYDAEHACDFNDRDFADRNVCGVGEPFATALCRTCPGQEGCSWSLNPRVLWEHN